MSLTQIEYFVAVAEEGQLTRAAKRLCVSQPPLTRSIQSLEEELGAQLFVRSAKGMQLLPAGERFLVQAHRVLDAVREAKEAVLGSTRDGGDGDARAGSATHILLTSALRPGAS